VQNDELIVTDYYGELFSYTVHQQPDGHQSINPQMQELQEALFHEKQTIIENCLFGVDINPNSVKICRLRLWIELLKNAYYQSADNFTELQTLPNIDINIKQGNSLLSRYPLTADLQDAFGKKGHSLQAYREAVQEYKHINSKDTKKQLVAFLDEIKQDFKTTLANNDPLRKKMSDLRGQIAVMQNPDLFGAKKVDKKLLQQKQSQLLKLEAEREQIETNKIYEGAFEWRFEFPEVLDEVGNYKGFDVVIGNPPYIRQEELGDFKLYLKKAFATYAGTADLYIYFVEQGINLLKQGGQFSYIIPNKWMRAGYGQGLRAWLKSHTLEQLLDFGDLPVFEEATTYPLIVSVTKRELSEGYTFKAAPIKTLDFEQGLLHYVQEHGYEVQASLLPDTGWNLSDSTSQQMLPKLEAQGLRLAEYVGGEIYRGVLTGLTEAFVIDEATKDKLINEDSRSRELIKPIVLGRDIKPLKTPEVLRYLIFTRRGVDIDEYPAIKGHLLQFRDRLEPKPSDFLGKKWSGRKSGNYKWFEIQDSVEYFEAFEKPKIMYQKFQVKPCFIYDKQGLFCNDSIWIIPTDDTFLLAILNSKLGWFLISNYCTGIQNGYQLIYKYLGQLPIATADEETKESIRNLVEQVLAAKQADAATDTSTLEAEIDLLVYRLYNLTYDEVLLVEPSFAMSREKYMQFEEV
jgi:adenine-specific DNA-methyltransferase